MANGDEISRSERLEKLYRDEMNPGRIGAKAPSLFSPREMREHYERTGILKREMAREGGLSRRSTRNRSMA